MLSRNWRNLPILRYKLNTSCINWLGLYDSGSNSTEDTSFPHMNWVECDVMDLSFES